MDKGVISTTVAHGTSSVDIGLIYPEHLQMFWPAILQHLQDQEPSWLQKITPQEVYRHLHEGNWELWGGMRGGVLDGFIIAQWDRFDRVKNYKIMVVVGINVKLYLRPGLEKVEKYVMQHGGSALDIEALPRLEKLFKRLGYHTEAVVMRKSVVRRWGN